MMNAEMIKLVDHILKYDAAKRDITAEAAVVEYGNGGFRFDDKPIRVTHTALRQLCALAGIPPDFFAERMTPAERSVIFNRLIMQVGETDRLFRFHNDLLYGVVSPRYKKLDNVLLIDILQSAEDSGLGLRPVRADLHPDHSKVRLVPDIPRVGELAPMIEFTNSENGLGSLQVYAGVYRWFCTNGLMVPVSDITRARWMHLGNRDIQLPDLYTVLNRSLEFIEKMDRARTQYLSATRKERLLTRISRDLGQKAAERVVRTANREYNSGRTRFDLVNAVTRAAQGFPREQQSTIERYASTLLAA
jgi:hypothetical protein